MFEKQKSRAVTAALASVGVLMVSAVLFAASRNDGIPVVNASQQGPGDEINQAENASNITATTRQDPTKTTALQNNVVSSQGTNPAASVETVAVSSESSSNEQQTPSTGAWTTTEPSSPASSQSNPPTTTATSAASDTNADATTTATTTAPIAVTASGVDAQGTTTTAATTTPPTTASPTKAPSTTTDTAPPTSDPGRPPPPDPLTLATPGGNFVMAGSSTSTLILPKGSSAPSISGPLLLIPISSLVDTGDERWELRANGVGEATVTARTAEGSTTWIIEVVAPGY